MLYMLRYRLQTQTVKFGLIFANVEDNYFNQKYCSSKLVAYKLVYKLVVYNYLANACWNRQDLVLKSEEVFKWITFFKYYFCNVIILHKNMFGNSFIAI